MIRCFLYLYYVCVKKSTEEKSLFELFLLSEFPRFYAFVRLFLSAVQSIGDNGAEICLK